MLPLVSQFVEIENGRLPLIPAGEIEVTVSVDIGDGDSSRHLRLREVEILCQIEETPVLAPHEEWIVILAAEVVARLETMPCAGSMKQEVIPHGDFVQFGPAIV